MDAPVADHLFEFEGFRLDRRSGGLFRQDRSGATAPVDIGSRALDVLAVLLSRPGELLSKQTIMRAVWPGMVVDEKNLTVQIAALRRVLDDGRTDRSCIQTEAGRGYRFVAPVTRKERDGLPYADPPALASPVGTFAAEIASRRSWPRRWLLLALGGIAATLLIAALAWKGDWFASQPPPPRLSLVVLPFDNLASDGRDDYLAAGITDGLTTVLSHIPGAFVIARATAYTYRGKAEDIRKIGRDLNVRYVVRGSIQRLGEVLKVNAELGSTETGAQLWSDSFDQPTADLAAGQEQTVVRMRAALNISLADIEAARSLRERPTNPDAFDLILRARAIEWLPQTKDTAAQALKLYEQALARDPSAVLALAGASMEMLNLYYYEAMPYDEAGPRAVQYLERAQKLEPNAEIVLLARSQVLDFQQQELDYRRVRAELRAVGQKLVDLYPNNPVGYFRLGVVARNEGRWDEAASHFASNIRHNPRNPMIKGVYWSMAYCNILAGHDREGLEWADRAMRAEGGLPAWRVKYLSLLRVTAYVRTGDVEAAKRLAKELNDHYPFETWRQHSPRDDPGSETVRQQVRSFMDALRVAGLRDHVDPDADFGVGSDDVLHAENAASGNKTPSTAPGVTTVGTEQFEGMLRDQKPLVIDTMAWTWYRSIPGAIGLDFNSNTHGTFTDEVQKRLEQKLRELTGGNMAKPIVAVGWNAVSFDGYNLALRIRHAGYTNVYWYRGGREAWEVAGKPEAEVRPADW